MFSAKKMLGIFSVILSTILSLFLLCSCGGDNAYHTINETVFSSEMYIEVKYLGPSYKTAFAEMRDALTKIDKSINKNRPDSIIYKFNNSKAGDYTQLDETTLLLTNYAVELYDETDGAFDVSLSALGRLWGVDENSLNSGSTPTKFPNKAEIDVVLSYSGLESSADSDDTTDRKHFSIEQKDGKSHLYKKTDNFTLDFGGIAKGYAADELLKIAKKYDAKSVKIDLSGDLVLYGGNYKEGINTDYALGVDNPEEVGDQYICGIDIYKGSVTTSGDYRRFYTLSSVKACHIINGKTGMPYNVKEDGGYANDDLAVVSATVIGNKTYVADALSTAVCVLGAEAGAKLVKDLGYKAIIFTKDKRMFTVGDMTFREKQSMYLSYERIAL